MAEDQIIEDDSPPVGGLETKVRVVTSAKGLTLVQFVDDRGLLQRTFVPTANISYSEGVPYCTNAELGSPYGVPWAEMVDNEVVLSPETIQQQLRRYGVWTYEDMTMMPEAVRAAIGQMVKGALDAIKANALRYEQET